MKLIIDIPESYLNMQSIRVSHFVINKVWDAVKKGTPLPKGHGRLIDADALIKKSSCMSTWLCDHKECDICQYRCVAKYEIEDAETIIEADKEEEK